MASRLDQLGYARVFRHPRTGQLVVDTDSLRRGTFAGNEDFEGDDDDFGDDELEGEEDFEGDDDFGDDEVGEDEVEGDDADFGARGDRRRRRLRRHLGRRDSRPRKKVKVPRRPRPHSDAHWGMTAVGGTDTLIVAGAATVKIRLQHDFRAQDVTFTGSAAGAKVGSIFFGDRVVWSNSDGIDVSVFSSSSFLRGLLKGQSLRAGLDITINGTLPGAGDFAVTLIGQKPVSPHC